MRFCLLFVCLLAILLIFWCSDAHCASTADDAIESIKRVLDSPIRDIQWAAEETVFVITSKGTLYRSSDGGRTLQSQMSKLAAGTKIQALYISPADPTHILFVARHHTEEQALKPTPTTEGVIDRIEEAIGLKTAPATTLAPLKQTDPLEASPVLKEALAESGEESDAASFTVHSYVTTNAGQSYLAVDDLEITDARLHPTRPEWFLAATRSVGCIHKDVSTGFSVSKAVSDLFSNNRFCYKSLLVSRDFGRSFKPILDYVVQFDWSPAVGRADGNGKRKSDELIYVTANTKKKGNQKFGVWDVNIHFIASFDDFASQRIVVEHGNRFLFGNYGLLFVAAVDSDDAEKVKLKVSRDNDTRLEFYDAYMPEEINEHSYTILDTSEGSVFLHVNHKPLAMNSYSGHVYTSDFSGLYYSLSLPHNHRSADGRADFVKIHGLEGIYIANYVDEELMAQEEEEKELLQTKADQKGSGDRNAANQLKPRHERQRIRTLITYDKGATWDYLNAPDKDADGKPIKCYDNCHLHLHGVTDKYGPVYSSANAVGLIMATGSVGPYLRSAGDVNTYFSRDGGVTWFEVAKGAHIYEFGDHGSLIVMAPEGAKTTSVMYSWDEGKSWRSLKLSEEPFTVENIITEPDATSEQFVVYGYNEAGQGVSLFVNFAELHPRICQGEDNPDSKDSDYERWSPYEPESASGSRKCILGHQIEFVRRKRSAACFNPVDFERPRFVKHCDCTEFDFECDYGHERKIDKSTGKTSKKKSGVQQAVAGQCVASAIPPLHPDVLGQKETCEHASYYRITKGYRRVPGNTCVGGGRWEAQLLACPSSFFSSGSMGTILLVILALAGMSSCAIHLAAKYDVHLEDYVTLPPWLLSWWTAHRGKFVNVRYHVLGAKVGQQPESMVDDDAFYLSDEEAAHAHLIDPHDANRASSGAAAAASAGSSKDPSKPDVRVPIAQPVDFNPRAK